MGVSKPPRRKATTRPRVTFLGDAPQDHLAGDDEVPVSYTEFSKLDIRVGVVESAEDIPKSRNLVKLRVNLGEAAPRQIIAGLKGYYEPTVLEGKRVVVLANLKPRKLMGLESQGMLLAADVDHEPFLLEVDSSKDNEIPPGAKVR